MKGPAWWEMDTRLRESWRGKIALCLHHFCGSTEKQDVRELPGLPRSRDPGEGEPEGCVPEWEDPEKPLGWSRVGNGGGGLECCIFQVTPGKPHLCY